jgi:hypothetical protein
MSDKDTLRRVVKTVEGLPPAALERFTVKASTYRYGWRWWLRCMIPPRRWCHERRYPNDWSGGECRFRLGHPYPHENSAGVSWPTNPNQRTT